MGMTIDDSVKQKLLDVLAEEPTMVISTAYVYAKNYVNYGEDITKAWTTAVQQSSILQKARQQAWAEAYDSFKKDYESRLKDDMVAMLTEIQAEIKKLDTYDIERTHGLIEDAYAVEEVDKVILKKINALKGESEK